MKLLAEISFRGLYYFLTQPNYRRFIGLVLRYGDVRRHRAVQLSLHGYRWQAPDAYSMIWQYKEIFADKSYSFQTTSKQPVIVDCGSNIGLSCLHYFLAYPQAKVFAFEPDPEVFKVLSANVAQLPNHQISLQQAAVWKEDSTLTFYQNDVDGGSLTTAGSNSQVQVKAIDLAAFLESLEQVDFLKMDVEGAESVLVPHIQSQLHKIKNLFIEYHSYPGQPQDLGNILGLLEAKGFRYFLMTQNRRPVPMVNKQADRLMDYQTNIYAYQTAM